MTCVEACRQRLEEMTGVVFVYGSLMSEEVVEVSNGRNVGLMRGAPGWQCGIKSECNIMLDGYRCS